jgi:hypothetical protein
VKRLLVLPTESADLPVIPLIGDALAHAQSSAFPLDLRLRLSPEEVDARLARSASSAAPAELKRDTYLGSAEVDSLSVDMATAGSLAPAVTACFGTTSTIVFQFVARKLYAMSFRFVPDSVCPSVTAAADELYQRLLNIPYPALPSQHYRVKNVDVVDAWDPTVTSVVRRRWDGQP